MRRITKTISALALAAGLVFGMTACDQNSSKEQESDSRDSGYDVLVKNQPGKNLQYSPTRETINFWVDTWDEPGKLSYVYLQSSTGDLLGYYVLKGLPVSYCAQISPNYDTEGGDGRVVVPAPANDGAYYGNGNCNTYYGQDATTGSYIEYTAGLGINVLLFDQPLPNTNGVPALGGTTIDDVENGK